MTWILIIEDDEATQIFLADLLEEEGSSALQAAGGAAVLMFLRALEHQLVVLLDYRPPDMPGIDLLQEVAGDTYLRQDRTYLLVTADAHHLSADEHAILDAQHIPVIAKPFDIDDLLDAIILAQTYLTETEHQPGEVG